MKTTKTRYSKQREMILTNLQNRHDHPTAEMIYNDLKETCPHLSLGTVYRNLNQLTENNDIIKLDFGGPMVRFDANMTPHIHFICEQCGTIYDLENHDDILKEHLNTKHHVKKIIVNMTGICHNCLEKVA